MYADYAYYKDSFGGDLTAEEFNRYARKAERFLNYVIMGEIPEVTEQVKNAVCAAAEAVAEIRGGVANIPQGIKSESTDGYSVTYKDYNADELAEREKKKKSNVQGYKTRVKRYRSFISGGEIMLTNNTRITVFCSKKQGRETFWFATVLDGVNYHGRDQIIVADKKCVCI